MKGRLNAQTAAALSSSVVLVQLMFFNAPPDHLYLKFIDLFHMLATSTQPTIALEDVMAVLGAVSTIVF